MISYSQTNILESSD